MSDTIHYGQMMHKAMRGLLAEVLRDVGKNGLPGEHHFFITFDTTYEGVEIPPWLVERYPEEMTIVMQEWFANLTVTRNHFTVTLNFGDEEVPMLIPFDAIRTFVDPSVEFGLRFDSVEDGGESTDVEESPMIVVEEDDAEKPGDAEVVSLDSFRK